MFVGLHIFLFFYIILNSEAVFKFTNVKCIEHDKSFVTIPLCKLKLVQRGVVALNIKGNLHQVPVNNISINMELKKKASGYKPFLYNVSDNFCQIMKRRKAVSFIGIVINLLKSETNINHTCPYKDDIVVDNLILKDEMFQLLPLPSGDYLFILRLWAYNNLKASINIYFSVEE